MSRVVLAMSGGVDSSVAAKLLCDDGHDVVGVFMRHGGEPTSCSIEGSSSELPILNPGADHKQGCCSATDAEDARRVAHAFGIPFYPLDLQDQFDSIMGYFVDEYVSGRTPNPCVVCNNWLKFGKLFDYADSIDADFVATGHYARLDTRNTGDFSLTRGIDGDKDQSYVLFGVRRERFKRMLLPIGGYRKPEIREIAASIGLNIAQKKDSQEICFVTTGRHAEFVAARKGNAETSGHIVTTDGKVLAEHDGIERFTIGQRKGLGVAMGEPYFVVKIDPTSKNVVIGKKEDLARVELTANRTNWLVDVDSEFRCEAQIRYNSSAKPATVTIESPHEMKVVFDEPCYGVAPGQAVVCYDGDRVLGGGWIL